MTIREAFRDWFTGPRLLGVVSAFMLGLIIALLFMHPAKVYIDTPPVTLTSHTTTQIIRTTTVRHNIVRTVTVVRRHRRHKDP